MSWLRWMRWLLILWSKPMAVFSGAIIGEAIYHRHYLTVLIVASLAIGCWLNPLPPEPR